MVNTCCVPGCKTGYRSVQADQEKPALYQFPKDNELRRKWIRAIPRQDWNPSNSSRVCAKHFHKEDFKTTSTDSRNNRRNARKSQTLQKSRLNPCAIPQIFPNLPSYLSSSAPVSRSINSTSSARREKENAMIENQNTDFLEQQDMIENLDMVKEKLKHEVLPKGFVQILNDENVQFHYFNPNSNEIVTPTLLASTIITNDMKLHSFLHGTPVPHNIFKDLTSTGYVTKMSVLLNILALQKSMLCESGNARSASRSLELALLYLQQYIEHQQTGEDCNCSMAPMVSFVIEQLKLCQVPKHARRYSISTMKTAFLWQLTSNALYKKLQSFFVLPSVRWLQNLSAGASISSAEPSINLDYLQVRSNPLTDKEKMVTLMMDEVYVAERIEYSNGCFIGITENGTPAKTVLGFMIQSICSNYKDIVCLIPVSTLDTQILQFWFNKVMVALGNLFHVVAVSTDNHVCNRKLFLDLCGGELQPSIPHPTRNDDQLFLIFDFTHNFKNIFNNFIGRGRFNFPAADFSDLLGQCCIARFEHIKRLYALEEHKTLKIAFALKKVSLNPSNLARTSPQHALSLFSESTARGLRFYSAQYPDFSKTAAFVEFIGNVWKVMSLKTPSKGIHKKDVFCKPLDVVEKHSLDFLIQAKSLFTKWRDSGNAGLTKETFLACIQSLGAMIELCLYLHDQHEFRYTLPGKFMSDPIEGRFGWYRQASGGNFYMSVKQLMLAEKKIRILSRLQQKMLVEASKFSLQSIVLQSSEDDAADSKWLHDFFIQMQIGDVNEMSLADANVTYYVSGYIGRSICRRRKCAGCKELLLSDKEHEVRVEENLPHEYMELFEEANRGGLSAPTELCYAITALAVQAYTALSADAEMKKKLLTATNQRAIFIKSLSTLVSESALVLRQRCQEKHDNFELIVQTAFNCFAKNELKRLNSKKSEPPAKMQRTARKLTSKSGAKHV